jgi:hypothetical protein
MYASAVLRSAGDARRAYVHHADRGGRCHNPGRRSHSLARARHPRRRHGDGSLPCHHAGGRLVGRRARARAARPAAMARVRIRRAADCALCHPGCACQRCHACRRRLCDRGDVAIQRQARWPAGP